MTVKFRSAMLFISCRMAVPILTALAESLDANANGLATMSRGALVAAWAVERPRGMPCAANGADNVPAVRRVTTRRDKYIPWSPQQDSPLGPTQPRSARVKNGRRGIRTPDI